MLWFKLAVVVCSALFALGQIFLEYVWHDRRTRVHKRARTLIQLLVGLSLLVTAWTVYKDDQSQQDARLQAVSLRKELEDARNEAKNRDAVLRTNDSDLLAKSQTIIDKTEKIADLRRELAASSRESLQQITGGNSYCYLEVSFAKQSDKADLILLHKGRYPLYDLQLMVRDLGAFEELMKMGSPGMEAILKSQLFNTKNVGELPPNKVLLVGQLDLKGYEIKRYLIQIEARNGTFFQPLRLRKVNGDWKAATQVYGT